MQPLKKKIYIYTHTLSYIYIYNSLPNTSCRCPLAAQIWLEELWKREKERCGSAEKNKNKNIKKKIKKSPCVQLNGLKFKFWGPGWVFNLNSIWGIPLSSILGIPPSSPRAALTFWHCWAAQKIFAEIFGAPRHRQIASHSSESAGFAVG